MTVGGAPLRVCCLAVALLLEAGPALADPRSLPAARGELSVQAAQAGARILLDGEQVGSVPFWVSLAPGLYRIEVQSLAGARFVRNVTIAAGQRVVVFADFTAAPSADSQPGRRRIWTWIAAGLAAAAGVTALGVGLSARAEHGHWEEELRRWLVAPPAEQPALQDRLAQLEDSVQRKAVAANVLIGASAALAVTAAVLFFVERSGTDRPARRLSRLSLGHGSGLRLEVGF